MFVTALLLYEKLMKFSLSGFLSIFSAITIAIIVICVTLIVFQKVGFIEMDKKSVHIVNELLAEKSGIPLSQIEDIEGFDEMVPEELDYSYDEPEGC